MLSQVSNPLRVVEPLELLEFVLHLVEHLLDSLLAIFSDLLSLMLILPLLILLVCNKPSSWLL